MNEQDTTTENKAQKKSKISFSEYIDLCMAAINTIIIICIFALIRKTLVLLIIIGFILVSVLVIGTILTFIKRNHFYIYFCYGLTLCGVTGTFIGFTTIAILWIIFILQGFYIYRIIEFNIKELLEKHRKSIEIKFKFNSITLISLCCSIGLFLSLIFSV